MPRMRVGTAPLARLARLARLATALPLSRVRTAALALVSVCAFAGCSAGTPDSAAPAGGSGKNGSAVAGPGYSGKGAVTIQTAIAGDTKINLGGNIAFEQRGQQVRIDVLSLGIPGMDPTLNAALGTQLFPPGGFSFVYDRDTSKYLVWSPSKRSFYEGTFAAPAAAGGNGSGAPKPVATPAAPANPFAFAKELKQLKVLSIEVSLSGHSTTNGHPTTGITYQLNREDDKGQATNIHGGIQFADDLDGMPVQLTAAFKGQGAPESALRLDLTDLARRDSPLGDFRAPADFTHAASLADVLGRVPGLPGQ
jgi:hypothetical protein